MTPTKEELINAFKKYEIAHYNVVKALEQLKYEASDFESIFFESKSALVGKPSYESKFASMAWHLIANSVEPSLYATKEIVSRLYNQAIRS